MTPTATDVDQVRAAVEKARREGCDCRVEATIERSGLFLLVLLAHEPKCSHWSMNAPRAQA